MLKAGILTIGDEILIGQITDTNSAAISRALGTIGLRTTVMLSCGDGMDEICGSLTQLLSHNDVVVVTGGLGPTKDDITKKALARLSGSTKMLDNAEQAAIVRRILTARGIELSDLNLQQSMVPDTCRVLPNQIGTAPGMVFRMKGESWPHEPLLYSLPGVPFECEGLLEAVLNDIKSNLKLEDIYHRNLVPYGIPESILAKKIEAWEDALGPRLHLAYLPNPIVGVKLRLSCYGGDRQENVLLVEKQFGKLREILGDAVYGEGEDTLPVVIGRILRSRKATLAVAESCTGGKIASLMTEVPGASEYFYGSVTSYDNSVKTNVLGVSEAILAEHGAVSSECAEAMARGVMERLGTTYGLSTTGIAGPGGGSAQKPVGTVWIGVARRENGQVKTESRMLRFGSERLRNIERFAGNALNILRLALIDEE